MQKWQDVALTMPGMEREREYKKMNQKAHYEVTAHQTKILFELECIEKFKVFYEESYWTTELGAQRLFPMIQLYLPLLKIP